MNILENIENFGSIDAESDNKLIEYFYHSKIIELLLNYEKSIVIGRKGSGKTAIYKYIQHENEDAFSSLLFKDYPWKLHDKYCNTIVSQRESYVNSWTFYFYIEIFKKIIKLKAYINDKKTCREVKKLEKWVKRNWGSIDFDHREVMSPTKPKYSFTFNPQIFGNSLGSLSRDFESADSVSATLTEYNKKLDAILKKILDTLDIDIILAFDELDLAYDANDENYKNRLIGLLLTTYNFYQKYRKGVKVYVFLRNDIFNLLDFQDKNKIKDNIVEFLDWDGSSITSKLSLKNLVANRIKYNINAPSDNFDRVWNEIFDENKIGKNQLKWNFIIERTFLRPRDVIKFLNLVLEETKNRLKNNPESIDKISNEDIRNIRVKYSTYLYEELKDEISGKYSDFNEYFEILRNVHTVTFTRQDFENSYNSIKSRFNTKSNIDIILERLYEFSIIGFYKPGGGGYGGSEYRFQYKSDYQAFNPQATKFKVHSGFKEHLELIEK